MSWWLLDWIPKLQIKFLQWFLQYINTKNLRHNQKFRNTLAMTRHEDNQEWSYHTDVEILKIKGGIWFVETFEFILKTFNNAGHVSILYRILFISITHLLDSEFPLWYFVRHQLTPHPQLRSMSGGKWAVILIIGALKCHPLGDGRTENTRDRRTVHLQSSRKYSMANSSALCVENWSSKEPSPEKLKAKWFYKLLNHSVTF